MGGEQGPSLLVAWPRARRRRGRRRPRGRRRRLRRPVVPEVAGSTFTERLDRVRERIAGAGGDPDRTTIVAVSKGHPAEACRQAVDAGLLDLGENRAKELAGKAPDVPGARWHFVGRLQTNKVRSIAGLVHLWQSVDRDSIVDELAARVPGARVLVQVNISGEPQKGGCEPDATAALVARARDAGLDVVGLMGVAAAGPPESARPAFRSLVRLADELALPERSIGMSGDLEVAVQEGATIVRIGTALFGARVGAEFRTD